MSFNDASNEDLAFSSLDSSFKFFGEETDHLQPYSSPFNYLQNADDFGFDGQGLLNEIFNATVNNTANAKVSSGSSELAPRSYDSASELANVNKFIKQYSLEQPRYVIQLPQDQNFNFNYTTTIQKDADTTEEISRFNSYEGISTEGIEAFEMFNQPDQLFETPDQFHHPDNMTELSQAQVQPLAKSTKPTGRVFKPRPKGSKRLIQIKRTFNYEGIDVPTSYEECEELQNVAKNPPPEGFAETYKYKLIRSLHIQERAICTIKRGRYIRHGLEDIFQGLHADVVYEKNSNFDFLRPYEPQYIRYIVDLDTNPVLPFNHTRSGLCPYCPEVHFYDIKTSAYAQHLALQHGIYTDNFLTPNPLFYGHYKIKKLENMNRKYKRKTQAHELERDGVICPCCYETIGVNCSKKTADTKPLTNYMRHFRDRHIYCKEKNDPYVYFNKFER